MADFAYDSRIDSNRRRRNDKDTGAGRVVEAPEGSFAALEELARRRDAKGCFIDRGGAHRREKAMVRWLRGVEEEDLPFGEFAAEQLMVAPPPRPDCGDAACPEASCARGGDDDAATKIAGRADIGAACARLVADLPAPFRDDVRRDAAAIAGLSARLRPEAPWLTLRLEVAQYDACWRWHQDAYVCRTLVTYVGPGTCAADDVAVRWDAFDRAAGEETNDECVAEGGVVQMRANAVLLMKGNAWPGILGEGLTHKAPGENEQDGDEPAKRLLLKVDLHNHRPPLGDEPFGGEEDEGDENEDEDEDEEAKEEDEEHEEEDEEENDQTQSRVLKRSATSGEEKTSKVLKARR